MGFQHQMIGGVQRMNAPAVVAAADLEAAIAADLGDILVLRQVFVRLDEPRMFDQELRPAWAEPA